MNVHNRQRDAAEELERQSRERRFLKDRFKIPASVKIILVAIVLMILWDFKEFLKGVPGTAFEDFVTGMISSLKFGTIFVAISVIPFLVFAGLGVALERLGKFPRLNAILFACATAPAMGVVTIVLGSFIWLPLLEWLGIAVDEKAALGIGAAGAVGWGIHIVRDAWPGGNGRSEGKRSTDSD